MIPEATADTLTAVAREHGVAVVRQAVPAVLVAALRRVVLETREAQAWLADVGADPPVARPGARLLGHGFDDPTWIALQQAVQPTDAFTRLRTGLVPLVALAAGTPVRPLLADILRVVLPHALELTTPPHQDSHYLPLPGLWNAWCPLTTCPLALGTIAVWPGSHRDGTRVHVPAVNGHPGVPVPEVPPAASPLQPGDVVLFSGLTVHGALPNVTRDRVRFSVDYRYVPLGSR